MESCRNGDKVVVEHFLLEKGEVNQQDSNGYSPLLIASQYGHLEIVQLLLEHKADSSWKSFDGSSCLYLATKSNQISVVQWLWKNIPFSQQHLLEVLKFAIVNNKTTIVKNYFIDSALSMAPHLFFACALYGHYDVVKDAVLKKHLNPNMGVVNGWNVVFASVRHIQILNFLINKHWNQQRCNGYSLLLFAIQSDAPFTVKWLLKNKIGGGNVNDFILENKNHSKAIITNKFHIHEIGLTALSLAVKCNHFEIVDLLLQNGADIYFPLPHNQHLLSLTTNPMIKQRIVMQMTTVMNLPFCLEKMFYYYFQKLLPLFSCNPALIIASYLVTIEDVAKVITKKK